MELKLKNVVLQMLETKLQASEGLARKPRFSYFKKLHRTRFNSLRGKKRLDTLARIDSPGSETDTKTGQLGLMKDSVVVRTNAISTIRCGGLLINEEFGCWASFTRWAHRTYKKTYMMKI